MCRSLSRLSVRRSRRNSLVPLCQLFNEIKYFRGWMSCCVSRSACPVPSSHRSDNYWLQLLTCHNARMHVGRNRLQVVLTQPSLPLLHSFSESSRHYFDGLRAACLMVSFKYSFICEHTLIFHWLYMLPLVFLVSSSLGVITPGKPFGQYQHTQQLHLYHLQGQ